MTALFLESQMNTNTLDDLLIIGGLAQLAVGVIQLFGASCRTIYALCMKKEMKQLLRYWLIVAMYFLVLFFIAEINDRLLLLWLPLAWLIAIWYCVKIVFNKPLSKEI